MSVESMTKAIAGGLSAATVALLSRYGFTFEPEYLDVLNVVLTGIVGYCIGHLGVYFAPANKESK